MLFAIDVGNTQILMGVYDGEELRFNWRLSTNRARTVDEFGILARTLFTLDDVEAVVDQDAGRTFILHGPVAARHTDKQAKANGLADRPGDEGADHHQRPVGEIENAERRPDDAQPARHHGVERAEHKAGNDGGNQRVDQCAASPK